MPPFNSETNRRRSAGSFRDRLSSGVRRGFGRGFRPKRDRRLSSFRTSSGKRPTPFRFRLRRRPSIRSDGRLRPKRGPLPILRPDRRKPPASKSRRIRGSRCLRKHAPNPRIRSFRPFRCSYRRKGRTLPWTEKRPPAGRSIPLSRIGDSGSPANPRPRGASTFRSLSRSSKGPFRTRIPFRGDSLPLAEPGRPGGKFAAVRQSS